MKGIETGGGTGRPKKPLKKKPEGIVPTIEKFAADTVKQANRPKRAPAALDVLPTKKGEKAKPYRPPVAKKIVRKANEQRHTRQSEVKDTKGNSDRLPEAQRQAIVDDALTKITEHVVKNQEQKGGNFVTKILYGKQKHPGYSAKDPIAKNLAAAGYLDKHALSKGGLIPSKRQTMVENAAASAPVLKVLDQTTRPLHAIAGASDAAITGKDPFKAAKRGIENKDKTTFSTVLKHAGAPKSVQKVGGFALDVAADPTTYVSFGTASVTKKAALDAAKAAEKKALRAGMTEAGAKNVAKAAVKKAEASAPAGKGVSVSFAGKQVPGVTRPTAASARVVKKVATKAPKPARSAAAGGKDIAREFRPMMAPGGAAQTEHEAARRAARKARSTINRGAQDAEASARALHKKIGEKNYAAVIDAVERNDFSKLSPELAKAAHHLRSQFKGAKRIRQRAGLSEGTVGKSAPRKVEVAPAYEARIYHGTDEAGAKSLKAEGLKLDKLKQTTIARGLSGTTDKSVAENYASHRIGGKVVSLDVKFKKPFVWDAKAFGAFQSEARTKGVDVTTVLRSKGYDGVVIHANGHGVHDEHIILDPRAVRSVGDASKNGSSVGSREAFIRDRPKPSADSPTPDVADLTRSLKPGKPGVSIESEHIRQVDRETRQVVGYGSELPGSKVVVERGADGEPIGALRMSLDAEGKPDILEVAVAPGHRGKGVASRLYAAAEKAGFDVEAASGRGGLTEAGAALKHKRLLAKVPVQAERPAKILRPAPKTARGERSPVRGYFPHAQDEPLRQGLGLVDGTTGTKSVKGGGQTVPSPSSARSRDIKLPISEANPKLAAEGKGKFSTNIPLVKVNYDIGTAKTHARSQLFKDLAADGRPIKIKVGKNAAGKVVRDIPDVHLRDGDQIYHLGSKSGTFGLHEVDPKDWAKGTVAKNGQFVVLNKKVVDSALESARSAASTHATGRAFDKVTRGFKSVATATPGFHVRNAIGDTTMAYYVQPGRRLPVNLAQAAKAVKGMHNQQKAVENLATSVDDHGTIKVAGKRMPRQQFLKLAQDNGVTQSGKIGRELRDLEGQAGKAGVGKVKRRLTNNKVLQTLTTDRENVVRLSTFKHGLDEGLSPAEAADLSLNTHIDYGDLTEVERRYARRLMPFYTFSARALPTHFKTLVQRPGKFATFQKVREETGSTALDPSLPDYQQRQAPLNIGGKSVTAGLPLTLLNEIPTSTNPAKFGAEVGNYLLGMLNPVIKDPLEYGVNKSFFFRSDIQNKDAPLVAAPSWVAHIPAAQRKKLGIVPDFIDKRSGKKVWGWPGKVDYVSKAVPGLPNIAQQLTTQGANRRGQGQAEKVAGALSGVKVQPYDPTSTQVQNTAKALAAVSEKIHALTQRGIGAKHKTHEYTTLRAEQQRLEQQLYQGKRARGDKILPRAGAPKKNKDPFAAKLDHAINSSSEDFSKKLDAAMNKLGS